MSLLHTPDSRPAEATGTADRLVLPFSLRGAPIARIALLDFTGDPTYTGLEVQHIDDPGGAGEGTAVLMMRHEGAVDVYFEPQLRLDRANYEWVGKGLAGWFPTAMTAAAFEITGDGLQLDVRFRLSDGRPLDLRLHERRRGAGRRFTLLAPAGHGSTSPTFLPVFWLPDVAFFRRRGATIDIRIADGIRPLVRAPIPWRRARYCAAPALAFWNQRNDGPAAFVPASTGEHQVSGGRVEVVEHHGAPALRSLTVGEGECRLAVLHEPPVPNLDTLHEGSLLKGRATVTVGDAELFGGGYRLRRTGDRVDLQVDVTRPWRPRDQSLIGAVMFKLLVFFRTWPTTYRWRGSVDLAPQVPTLTSGWERRRR